MRTMMGCDPEFFLKDKTGYVSAHDIVPGTKYEPYRLDKGAVQADGTAVEFNIDPAKTAAEFDENVETVLTQLRKSIPKKFEFAFDPYIVYEPSYFKAIPIEAKKLGCDPDFNMTYGGMNNAPKRKATECTGGGHLHFSWTKDKDPYDKEHFFDCRVAIWYFDNWYRAVKPLFDKDDKRTLYGAAGAFRPKSYGVEYRTPSNAWVPHRKLRTWLFESLNIVFKDAIEGDEAKRSAYKELHTHAAHTKMVVKDDWGYTRWEKRKSYEPKDYAAILVEHKMTHLPNYPE